MTARSIVFRLLAGLLLAGLVPLILLQQTLTERFAREMQSKITSNLAAIADHKVEQINSSIDRQIANAEVLARLPATREILSAADDPALRNTPLAQRYRALRQPYLDSIGRLIQQPGIYDLLLVTTTGDVIVSYKEEADLGTNLFRGPFRDTPLARAARQTALVLDASVSDFEWYIPSNAHAAFITMPVMAGPHLLGVLAIQVAPDDIRQVLHDNGGLGRSGETVLVQRTGNPPRIVSSLGTENGNGIFSDHLPQLALSQSLPLMRALEGDHGQGEAFDQRQAAVLAAWRYVPRTRWGLVVKMDASEAFAPVRELQQEARLLLLAALLLAAAIEIGRAHV